MSPRRGSARYSLSDEIQLMVRNKQPVVHSKTRTVGVRPKKTGFAVDTALHFSHTRNRRLFGLISTESIIHLFGVAAPDSVENHIEACYGRSG